MQLKHIIVSLACITLLMPPALGSLAIAKAAAFKAIKGASLIGAGLALKGKAALLAAQGLGQLFIKGAAIKDQLANANAAALMLQQRPVYYPGIPVIQTGGCSNCFPPNTVMQYPGPSLFDILSGVWRAVRNKVAIAGQMIGNMNCPPVVEYISRPNLYPVPISRCWNQFKRK